MRIKPKNTLAYVADKLRLRAYIFTCSYETAWNQYITDEEKSGYTFEEVRKELEKDVSVR